MFVVCQREKQTGEKVKKYDLREDAETYVKSSKKERTFFGSRVSQIDRIKSHVIGNQCGDKANSFCAFLSLSIYLYFPFSLVEEERAKRS